MATKNFDTKSARDRLPARREPYWKALQTGRSLGFRKTARAGFWLARYRADGRQHYRALGEVSVLSLDDAKAAAEAWFRTMAGGATTTVKTGTVRDAFLAYVDNLEAEGRQGAADEARWRCGLVIEGDRIGAMRLDRVTVDEVTAWRKRVHTPSRSASTVNKHLRILKAALNQAVRMGFAGNPEAWRSVRALPNAGRQRDLFLDLTERRALLNATADHARLYLEGLMHTAARPGELARALVSDFDARQGTLTLRCSKGRGGQERTRTFHLTPEALRVLKAAAKDKLPAAALFTNALCEPWGKMQLSRLVRAAAKKAGLPPGVVPYTLRHSIISEWLQAGINAVTVAKMAGTSVLMIEKHYHKFIAEPTLERLSMIQVV